MVGFEKALGAVKVIKDQIQYRSQSLLNLAHDYFSYQLLDCFRYGGDSLYPVFDIAEFDCMVKCTVLSFKTSTEN